MKIEIYNDNEKQAQLLKLLQFGTVMVFVDSRHPDVSVPGHLKGDFQLRLNFDYAYEIDDFRVLPERIEASLSFNKEDYFCVVPFTALYLAVNHEIQHGSLFVQSVPIEMLQYFAQEAEGMEQEAEKKQAAHLNVVEGQAATSPKTPSKKSKKQTSKKQTSKKSDDKKKPRKRGHLRLVK